MMYTVKEVSKILSIGITSAYILTAKDDFPKITIGTKRLIPKKYLEKWIDDNLNKKLDSPFKYGRTG